MHSLLSRRSQAHLESREISQSEPVATVGPCSASTRANMMNQVIVHMVWWSKGSAGPYFVSIVLCRCLCAYEVRVHALISLQSHLNFGGEKLKTGLLPL